MKNIKKEYESTVQDTLHELNIVLDELMIENPEISGILKEITHSSVNQLTEKWISGRKYVRTYFIKKALINYPKKGLSLSIQLDVIVNILDDLLDEELKKMEKVLYIVEFLRVFAIFNKTRINPKISKAIAKYFNELICIAVLEDVFYKMIENCHEDDEIINNLIKVYDCRSNDIDIFAQIPLFEIYGGVNKEVSKIITAARYFRAINLLKKDLGDINHDIEHNTTSVILILRENDRIDYKSILNKFSDHYLDEFSKLKSSKKDIQTSISNFEKLAIKDVAEFKKKLEDISNGPH